MDLNTHKRRKTTLYFKKLFIMVKVYFYDHPITKKNLLEQILCFLKIA